VSSTAELEYVLGQYLHAGYTVLKRDEESARVVLRTKDGKLIGCLSILFFPIGILMLLARLVSRRRSVVNLVVVVPGEVAQIASAAQVPTMLMMSPDHEHWWDGTGWRPRSQTPPMAPRSADGTLWFDGRRWDLVK